MGATPKRSRLNRKIVAIPYLIRTYQLDRDSHQPFRPTRTCDGSLHAKAQQPIKRGSQKKDRGQLAIHCHSNNYTAQTSLFLTLSAKHYPHVMAKSARSPSPILRVSADSRSHRQKAASHKHRPGHRSSEETPTNRQLAHVVLPRSPQ